MQIVSTIVSAVGDLLVAITVYLALRARKDARAAETRAEKTRMAFASQQQAAVQETELVRRRRRVEDVGEVIEKLFWTLRPFVDLAAVDAETWMPYRNRLAQLMVGLTEAVPAAASIVSAFTGEVAFESAKHGRQEVTNELERIDRELRMLHSPTIPPTPDVPSGVPLIPGQMAPNS